MSEQILIKKRSHIKAKLTRFITFLNECNENEEKRQETAVRLERVESIWKEFDAVQTELEDINEAELQSQERDSFENKFYQIPPNIKLADPTFHVPGKIDLLLGSEVFWKLLCVGQIQLGKLKPIFQKTKLGWVISGKADLVAQPWSKVQCHLAQQTIQHQLEKFWRFEEIVARQHSTSEEQKCEDQFDKTHS